MDIDMTFLADDERFPVSGCHQLNPFGLFFPSVLLQVF
jgi:hypothetical protein